ncbi:MAG: hypothetical protein AB6733_21245 [Clostridiaceae bacterium]
MNKPEMLMPSAVILVLSCMFLNFQEFLFGTPATEKNLIVTIVYLLSWILILITGIKNSSYKFMKYSYIFWIIMLLLSILTVYINVTGASVDWVLPFIALLLGQWYGLRFFVTNLLDVSIIIAFISLVMVASVGLSIKLKNEHIE